MQIQNNAKSARVLPDGTEIPGLGIASVDDAAWADAKKNVVVKAWLASKDLEEIKAGKAEKSEKDEPKK